MLFLNEIVWASVETYSHPHPSHSHVQFCSMRKWVLSFKVAASQLVCYRCGAAQMEWNMDQAAVVCNESLQLRKEMFGQHPSCN